MLRQIIWDKAAVQAFKEAIRYIKEDSIQNAAKVRDKILEQTDRLRKNPEMHPPDKYKSGNDGSYRAFETYRFRISYRVVGDEIRILRFRHTSQNPQEY